MEVWFEVRKEAVIGLLEKRKDCFPWGNHPEEKYRCLIFWEDGRVKMTVDEFWEKNPGAYECCRFYTDCIASTLEEYHALSEEKLAVTAYHVWCSGAR